MEKRELQERQGWSLERKIDHSLGVIEQFYSELCGKCYVSFSGGKDSTVCYWLARKIYPDIKAVFCNTGNEYPDIVKFVRDVKSTEGMNVEIIYPEMRPKEVLSTYGFPLVSKEQSKFVHEVRHSDKEGVVARRLNKARFHGQMGILAEKWQFLVKEPFDTSHKCCDVLKKRPFHKYEKETGTYPILGTMACESKVRETAYLRQGQCNSFGGTRGSKIHSMPLSIWMEHDILNCIERYKIPISAIYGKGMPRTGCMFCGYGCQYADDIRLYFVMKNYPKAYEMFMNYTNHGVKYRDALRKVLNVNGLNLPDEQPASLFEEINF